MIAGLSLSSCCGVTPFNVSTPISNPLLPKARKKNTTAYTRNIRAPNTIRPAPLRKDCSLDIVSSLGLDDTALERFQAKACPGLDPGWIPVRVKMRQNKKIEPRSDSIGTEKALARLPPCLLRSPLRGGFLPCLRFVRD